MGSALGARPADEAVARPQVSRRRRKCQSADGLTLSVDQVFEVLPNRLGVPQIMMGLHQTTEELFSRPAPYLADLQGAQLSQRTFQRLPHQGQLWLRGPMPRRIVVGDKPLRGQLNMARTVQLQHQAPSHHVARLAVGLYPVPNLAQLGREPTSA